MFKLLRNSFISGLLLLSPLGVTIFVLYFLVSKIGTPISKYIFWFVDQSTRTELSILFDILATVIAVLIITLLGLVSNYFLGRYFIRIFEQFMDRVPFINSLYRTVKQIVDTFSTQKKAVFQQAVLVQFPHGGSYAIGFITDESESGETQNKTGQKLINVFVPTSPIPTSGFLIMLSNDQIIRLEMSVADAMKVVISGGTVVPPQSEKSEPVAVNSLPAS